MESKLIHIKCIKTPQWPILSMVEALVCGLEGVGTMEARFLGCVVATHWLLHTLVQIFFRLILVHKKFWCSLSSLRIQTRVLAMTFHVTLLILNNYIKNAPYFRNSMEFPINFSIWV